MDYEEKRRYNELLMKYKARNTLELKDGKCACVKCKKLFRSYDFLNIHFNTKHAADLKNLEEMSKRRQRDGETAKNSI